MIQPHEILIVAGLPRSGTSMTMKMLEAGGVPVLADHQRVADEDNPKGYYEYERVKQLPADTAWLPKAEGKVVKMVSMLLYDLPTDRHYKVIFMRRTMAEILASQKKMLLRNNQDMIVDDVEMKELFEAHLQNIMAWLKQQTHLEILYVWYNDLLQHSDREIIKLNNFLGGNLNTAAMQAVIDTTLYRNRAYG
ncbi:MAG: sulfotransferase domain-containing protein [Candidatus Kerfeldbacteria bacterium]|nr:sulfotransferase domain-containing protein [Candidatus Kerfeldbacteria bacterium]